MPWWAWILSGLVLLGMELLLGTFYLLFLGLAAIVVGLLAMFGSSGPLWLEWVLFIIFSSGLVLLLRKPLLGKFTIRNEIGDADTVVGQVAVASEVIPPAGIGKVEMRGTVWTAHNNGATPLLPGQRCTVERIQGLSLWVRPS
ncbi:MAG TPA: NfeD family protein [Thermoanaerobaculia bacterium]|nr:NfeD family protein [Thermoanaerobaculia bacterium]